MAENQEATEAVEADVAEPYESESARYMRVRAAAKEEAAVTMEAEAKAALKAKNKRLRKAPVVEGQAEFLKRAAEIEKSINAAPVTTKEA